MRIAPPWHAFGDAMLDSILDHRLQDQTGNLRGQPIKGNIHAKLKAFGKARLLNVEIFLREFQFFGQRNLMALGLEEKPGIYISLAERALTRLMLFSKDDKVRNKFLTMQKQATITSKGQITVPREIRRALGVKSGDKLLFESDSQGIRIRPLRSKSAFSKYRGIGNAGIPSGRKSIRKWLRGMRGE